LGALKIDSYEAGAAIIGCANLQTPVAGGLQKGQGEIAYYVAIKGEHDVYIIQRSVRGAAFDPAHPPITPEKIAMLMRDILPIKLCSKTDSRNACWDRPAR